MIRSPAPLTILVTLTVLAGCSGPGPPPPGAPTVPPKVVMTRAAETPAAGPFGDPFAYCAAVGTIDQPDARYTGPPVPDSVVVALYRALYNTTTGTPTPDQRQFLAGPGTIWRCMGGRVYACNVGANIPCASRANTSRDPANTVMATYCQQPGNANAEVIPGAAMDRASIYEWRCRNGRPEVVRQVTAVDAAGYPASFWYELRAPG